MGFVIEQNANSRCFSSSISSNALASDVSRAGGDDALELAVAALEPPDTAELDASTGFPLEAAETEGARAVFLDAP